MPRRSTSATTLIVSYFMTATLDAARQALETGKAIVAAREGAAGTLPLSGDGTKAPRRRRERRSLQVGLPGATAATATETAVGPAAVVPAVPRRRRGRGAGAVPAAPVTVPELPPQVAAEE